MAPDQFAEYQGAARRQTDRTLDLARNPPLLGLSIGAMAILSAFSESKFLSLITQGGKNKSAYIDLSARLVHFILIQVSTVISGIFLKAYGGKALSFAATFLMNYALMSGIATAFALFGAAQLYNHSHRSDLRNQAPPDPS